MANPAHILLSKINPIPNRESTISAEKAVFDLINHLLWLKERHVAKVWSERYIVDRIFDRASYFGHQAEVKAYCRVNLFVAIQQFQKLVDFMKKDTGNISEEILKKYSDIIRDYLHDIRMFANTLEREKDADYLFFEGMKNYHVYSWQVFRFSEQLALPSAYKEVFDHKVSQITSIFALRQALEIKFQRLIGVQLYDRKNNRPKLKHDFYYDFIAKNPNFFDFKAVDFRLLRKIYEWCNDIVHQAYQPLAWQIDYAHEVCGKLFIPQDPKPDGSWSINNSVEINHLTLMQNLFIEHFVGNYDHGIWGSESQEPEALIVS